MPTNAATVSGMKMRRLYQPLDSKHRMKVSRYSASGRIHRNGIGATFCETWLVMASSSTDAHAGRAIHNP